MQNMIQILSTWDPDLSHDVPSLPTPWVEKIFTRLSAQLGHKVADLYACVAPDIVKAEWGNALAGFHPNEIKRGIDACQTRIFAPTLGEFLRLCRPALDPETAWIEASENLAGEYEWSHPAVRRAASQMSWELRSSTFAEMRKRWVWILEREFAQGWEEPEPEALRIKGPPKKAPPRATPQPEGTQL
jgi:hypothetical protein